MSIAMKRTAIALCALSAAGLAAGTATANEGRRAKERGTTVEAPYTRVEAGRKVKVEAPFTDVKVSERRVRVRAPFVDIDVPRR